MKEDILITQLKELRSIKPRKDWAVLAKKNILGLEPGQNQSEPWMSNLWRVLIFGEKLAFGRAGLTTFALALLMGLFGFAQNSTPGDTLYGAKKIILQGEAVLLSDQTEVHLRLAADSAQALKEAAVQNNVKKLSPALQEYEDSLRKAVGSLDKQPKNSEKILKIASLVQQIEKDSKEIEGVLNTEIASKERQELGEKTRAVLSQEIKGVKNELADIIARELESLSNTSLSDKQQELFEAAKLAFEEGDYVTAVEKISELGYIR